MPEINKTTISIIGLAITILLAFSGWVVAYLSKRKHYSRTAELERVNCQLKELQHKKEYWLAGKREIILSITLSIIGLQVNWRK